MDKLLWIDLEMTGLDVTRERIIEVAAIITDLSFRELAQYHVVVKQPESFITGMDEWNRRHHGASGLIAKIPTGKDPLLVDEELVELVKDHFPGADPNGEKDLRPVLAGNSIGQDRIFINQQLPLFASYLHYRMLDVSSWKIIFNHRYKKKYLKKGAHRAPDDIRESIEELKFYLTHVSAESILSGP